MAARAKRARRAAHERRASPAVAPAQTVEPTAPRLPTWATVLAAAIVAVALCAWVRWRAPAPWSYDEYYHLGLAREMFHGLRIPSFHWTPFSTAYHHFADGSPLFHLLLMPFARLPLERAAFLGALLGQVFLIGSFAVAMLALRVPRAGWLVLALPVLGALTLQRLEMCRPQLWLAGFAILVVALLALRRWRTLALTAALFGLAHTAGWIAIALALCWSLAGLVARDEGEPRDAPLRARAPWQPVAFTAGGWLAGQLLHPELPANFRAMWLAGFVIPFQATAAGEATLRSQLGTELEPPEPFIVATLWPAYVVALLVLFWLLTDRSTRTRTVLAAALPGLGFLAIGTVLARRFLELGAPLVLLALALVLRERARRHPRAPSWKASAVAAALVALAAWSSLGALRGGDYGTVSPPLGMARWLGAHGAPGERVFTAQWADAAPLFYAAPQLQSLVALDPTAFWVEDPARFEQYVRLIEGRDPTPVQTIRRRFGTRWVTLWRAPLYAAFAQQLYTAGARRVFIDPDYVVVDLSTVP